MTVKTKFFFLSIKCIKDTKYSLIIQSTFIYFIEETIMNTKLQQARVLLHTMSLKQTLSHSL